MGVPPDDKKPDEGFPFFSFGSKKDEQTKPSVAWFNKFWHLADSEGSKENEFVDLIYSKGIVPVDFTNEMGTKTSGIQCSLGNGEYHGIFRVYSEKGLTSLEIYTVKNGKRHGLCATSKG